MRHFKLSGYKWISGQKKDKETLFIAKNKKGKNYGKP